MLLGVRLGRSAPRSVFDGGGVKAGGLDADRGGRDPQRAEPHPDVLLMPPSLFAYTRIAVPRREYHPGTAGYLSQMPYVCGFLTASVCSPAAPPAPRSVRPRRHLAADSTSTGAGGLRLRTRDPCTAPAARPRPLVAIQRPSELKIHSPVRGGRPTARPPADSRENKETKQRPRCRRPRRTPCRPVPCNRDDVRFRVQFSPVSAQTASPGWVRAAEVQLHHGAHQDRESDLCITQHITLFAQK